MNDEEEVKAPVRVSIIMAGQYQTTKLERLKKLRLVKQMQKESDEPIEVRGD